MGNSFGKYLKLTTFGESHGRAIGGVLEGFPAGFQVDLAQLQHFVNRRRPTTQSHSTSRSELDQVEILSGMLDGQTLGTPIGFYMLNKDAQSADYESLKDVYRPSHADFTWQQKYGIRDARGGGRSSARETLSRVVAGGLALQYLHSLGIQIVASVISIGGIPSEIPQTPPDLAQVDSDALRCADSVASAKMQQLIHETALNKDSLGGVIHCWVTNLTCGLGEPVFDKLQSRLAAAMLSINAAKGFSYGAGFQSSAMTGSQHNDVPLESKLGFKTENNLAGGILGGISNGETLTFEVAFKPVASIGQSQKMHSVDGQIVERTIVGRHDVTVVPRAVPIVEAMTALTILDFVLLQKINK